MRLCDECSKKPHMAKGLCSTCYVRMRRRTDPEFKRKNLEATKKYNDKHRERRSASAREYRKKFPHKSREINLKSKYGITQADFIKMLTTQQNKCKICSKHMNTPVIDHCHKTGKVRGVLCNGCNTGLGLFKEDLNLFQKAIRYLGYEAV